MLVAFAVVAKIGSYQAAEPATVLPGLTPVVAAIRAAGGALWAWAVPNSHVIGWILTVACGLLLLLALAFGGLRAWPVALFCAGFAAAGWGQILLLDGKIEPGALGYAAGALLAFVAGIACPLRSLATFGGWPAAQKGTDGTRRFGWAEAGLVFSLFLVAVLARTWALNELPHGFDLEMSSAMLGSRTWAGFIGYMRHLMLTNNNGIFHLLTQMGLFQLCGTSLYALRMAGVLWGAVAVPLVYALVRRLTGVVPACVAAVLLLSAPEQLYWSRTENTLFAPVGVLALLTAHVGLWIVQRWSLASLLAAVLWIPISRFFYAPAMVMFLFPPALLVHGLLFVKGTWRRLWYTLPLVALGTTLWIFSFSLAEWPINNWKWRYFSPWVVHAGPIWTKNGDARFKQANLPELIRLQAELISTSTIEVAKSAVYTGERMFSHYYLRADPTPKTRTIFNVGFSVILALALSYLIPQLYDRRAFLLLLWTVLGLLPGVMSNEPSPRRTTVMFPALYASAAIFLAALVGVMRERAGRWVAQIAANLVAVALGVIVLSNLTAHYSIQQAPVVFDDHIRFTQPVFDESDTILHNLSLTGVGRAVVLGNADTFLARLPCYQQIESLAEWRRAILKPKCRIQDDIYPNLLWAEGIERARTAHRMSTITFLIQEDDFSLPLVREIQAMYPSARYSSYRSSRDARTLTWITLDVKDTEPYDSPALASPVEPPGEILDGVALRRDGETAADEMRVRGALFLESDGWYRFEVQPRCESARLVVAGGSGAEQRPLAGGLHDFELQLAVGANCALPLNIVVQAVASPPVHFSSLRADSLFSSAVLARTFFRAREVEIVPGFSDPQVVMQFSVPPMDFGVDASGNVRVLLGDSEQRRIEVRRHDGALLNAWEFDFPDYGRFPVLLVGAGGETVVLASNRVKQFERDGREVSEWRVPWGEWVSDVLPWGDTMLLVSTPDLNKLAVLRLDGTVVREWTDANSPIRRPVSLAWTPERDLVVVRDDGRGALFRVAFDRTPELLREFPVDAAALPYWTHGILVDADGIFVPEWSRKTILEYGLDGRRRMAVAPPRDFDFKNLGRVMRVVRHDAAMYILDRDRRQLLRFESEDAR